VPLGVTIRLLPFGRFQVLRKKYKSLETSIAIFIDNFMRTFLKGKKCWSCRAGSI
jgi:hypothetical protein